MTDLKQTRDDFVAYVRRQLVGPFDGPSEIIFDPPNRRYLMGILFPRQVSFEGYVEVEGEGYDETSSTDSGEESRFSDDPVSAANDFLPASQGLSFFTTAPALTVRARAAEYETLSGAVAEEVLKEHPVQGRATEVLIEEDGYRRKAKGSAKIWRRHQLAEATARVSVTDTEPITIWGGRAEIHVRWRGYPHGSLVTITLVNAREADDEQPERHWDRMLLQAEFDVSVPTGFEVLEYPSVALASHDPEEDELRLIHRKAKVYAIGHGCSPEWAAPDGVVTLVRSEVMPTQVVPRISAEGDTAQALDLAWLADETVAVEDLLTELNAFLAPYAAWIKKVDKAAKGLDDRYQGAAVSIIRRLERALERMRDGVSVFADHPDRDKTLQAFRLANRAMLIQMRHSQKDMAGSRSPLEAAPDMPAVYGPGASWRPFQLGFFLTTVRGLVDDQHDDRDIVDLIWFPTGGGKTEAYLLVAAFEIFRRRLVHGDAGGGTAVISMYTLSLLTADQFKRTAATTAACEYLRRRSPGLGLEPITVGLWVGEATSPNRYAKARERFEELRDAGQTDERFLLDRCPWCGTEIVPREHHEDDNRYGITSTDRSFAFNCPSAKCEFHERIPVQVVDDDLYAAPPTFLLGTVDKFAQLAWVPGPTPGSWTRGVITQQVAA